MIHLIHVTHYTYLIHLIHVCDIFGTVDTHLIYLIHVIHLIHIWYTWYLLIHLIRLIYISVGYIVNTLTCYFKYVLIDVRYTHVFSLLNFLKLFISLSFCYFSSLQLIWKKIPTNLFEVSAIFCNQLIFKKIYFSWWYTDVEI